MTSTRAEAHWSLKRQSNMETNALPNAVCTNGFRARTAFRPGQCDLRAVGVDLNNQAFEVRAAQAERDQYARQVENVQQENETLRSDIAEGPTEEKMKELAREELGMIDSNSYLFLDRSN